jgi:hypothetical protein
MYDIGHCLLFARVINSLFYLFCCGTLLLNGDL